MSEKRFKKFENFHVHKVWNFPLIINKKSDHITPLYTNIKKFINWEHFFFFTKKQDIFIENFIKVDIFIHWNNFLKTPSVAHFAKYHIIWYYCTSIIITEKYISVLIKYCVGILLYHRLQINYTFVPHFITHHYSKYNANI